jgi:hypothetical protein
MANIQTSKLNFVGRLNKAITACHKFKKTTDEHNSKMLASYVSGYNRKIVGKDPHPLNMVDRAVSIWLPFLVGGNPKVVIKPRINLEFSHFAYTFQLALNQWMRDMKFDERTLEPGVFNSLFNLGIVKTGTARADKKRISGYLTVTGRPFCEVVDLANYVFDVVAKDREQYEFEGDEYLVRTDTAKEMYPNFADYIKTDYKLYGEDEPKAQANPDKVKFDELHEYTRLIDLWLPKERLVITILPPHKQFNKILNRVAYKGPITGPYDVLGYKYYRGSTLPVPPIYSLMELDAAINCLFAKARNQAERLKKIGVYEGGNEKDAETAKNAKDGDMLGFNNAQSVKETTLGGVVPEIWDFLGFSLNQYSEQAGVTGLDYRTRTKTATQEQMLMANASRTLDAMSQKVMSFAENISMKLAYEMWNNPTLQISTIKKMPGIAEIPVKYNQTQQLGRFPGDYYLDVEMFSMQKLSAETKFQRMMQMLTGWIEPTMQLSVQQGKIPNIPEITKQLSNYMDLDVESWFLSEQMEQPQMNPYQQMSGKLRSADQRFGGNEGDNMNNRLAQMNAGRGATTRGM